MRPSAIIAQLRQHARYFNAETEEYVYPFGQPARVHGAAEYAALNNSEYTELAIPAAYVVPIEDRATDLTDGGSNVVGQQVEHLFGVVVVVDNSEDRMGIIGADELFDLRTALWAALLNWPAEAAQPYSPLRYRGSRLLNQNPARLYWIFQFSTTFEIDKTDGYATDMGLFDTLDMQTDWASPSNVGGGPDGQIDSHARLTDLYDPG